MKTTKRVFSAETRAKMSAAKLGKVGIKSNAWSGGSYSWYHNQSKKLYNSDTCDMCGLKLEDKASEQAFDMHCRGSWSDLSPLNWVCVCRSCHRKEHSNLNKLTFKFE